MAAGEFASWAGGHDGIGICPTLDNVVTIDRVASTNPNLIHTDNVYNALFNAAETMEQRLNTSLKTYQEPLAQHASPRLKKAQRQTSYPEHTRKTKHRKQ